MGDDHVFFTEKDLKEVWLGCIENIDSFMRSFLNEATPVSFDDYCLKVEAAPFVISRFSEPDRKELLNRLVIEHTGIPNASVQFVPRGTASIEKSKTSEGSQPLPAVKIAHAAHSSTSEILAQFNPDKSRKSSAPADNKKDAENKSDDSPAAHSAHVNSPADSAAENYRKSNLSSSLTFDTYVRGENNYLAVGAAIAVAETQGLSKYNPLFFYSGVGLGKTHLMHAIGNYIIKNNPEMRVLYITAEQFMNIYIEHVQNKSMDKFHSKYRDNIDVLLIDDIQFIVDGEKTQEEFFHTFEALRSKNKQIVISSDRPPELMPKITDRMRSRMRQGMVVDIHAPKLETRIAILHQKAKQGNYNVSDEILTHIAESYYANVRELEGALTRVMLTLTIQKKEITLENVKNVLESFQDTQNNTPSPEAIIKAVCEYFKVNEANLISNKRDQNIVKPRQLAMYLMREYTGLSLEAIGKQFSRNHTTVLHACRWAEENAKDSYVKNSLINLRDILKIK